MKAASGSAAKVFISAPRLVLISYMRFYYNKVNRTGPQKVVCAMDFTISSLPRKALKKALFRNAAEKDPISESS